MLKRWLTTMTKHFYRLVVACLFFAYFFTTAVLANPVLDNVGAGQVTIQQAPNNTTINQTSQKAILNWQSFNIGAQESTHFQQPAGGVALNRINPTQGASQIYGRLTATGQIILVNPAGIFFGPGSYVNVGGMIASTANITDSDFLNGYYRFATDPGFNGAIVNQGQIIAADNGLIALVGGAVSNDGMIQANMGQAVLASGNSFTMSFAGNELIGFSVDSGITSRAIDKDGNQMADGVKNTGMIIANGGSVLVSAKAAAGVLDNVINMEGVAQAQSVFEYEGGIVLSGDPNSGVVRVAGRLDASGKTTGKKGGKIDVTGYNILVDNNAVLDVSGDVGGGNINIGGNYQGKGPLPNSNALVMTSGANINADAITSGNGGNVILWSDYYTNANGMISAQGGSESGNGGFVETSGKQLLNVGNLLVDTSAANGLTGQWLLDPYNITISSSATSGGTFSGGSPTNTFTPTATANVLDSTINTNLGSTNVMITTGGLGTGSDNGDITVDGTAAINWSNSNTLTLNAYRNITLNASSTITSTSGGILTLIADYTGTGAGTVTNNGTLNINGNVDIYYNPTAYTSPTAYTNTGAGTLTAYMLVNTLTNLQDMSTNLAGNYALSKDIDASATSGWNAGAGFATIGNDSVPFTGYFDGQNYTISDLVINRENDYSVGLFGWASTAANISNLTLTNSAVTGYSFVGALVGYNQGIINNITVNNATITGTATSGGGFVGGLLGYTTRSTNTTFSDLSINNSSVTANRDRVGGIVGWANRTDLDNVYNTNTDVDSLDGSSYVGGIAGYIQYASISNAYNTGNIGSTTYLPVEVGGIAGEFSGDGTNSITNAYNTGNISGYSYVGGIVGYLYGYDTFVKPFISDSYNTGTITYQSDTAGGIAGFTQKADIIRTYNSGTITNDGTQNVTNARAGGIVGQIFYNSTITDSFNIGSILLANSTTGTNLGGIVGYDTYDTFDNVGNSVSDVYNSGYVSAGSNNGAIAGFVNTANSSYYNYSGAYYDTNTSNVTAGIGALGTGNDPVGVTGKTTTEMYQQATFTGWDFTTTWQIDEGNYYPLLQGLAFTQPVVTPPVVTPPVTTAPVTSASTVTSTPPVFQLPGSVTTSNAMINDTYYTPSTPTAYQDTLVYIEAPNDVETTDASYNGLGLGSTQTGYVVNETPVTPLSGKNTVKTGGACKVNY